VTTTRLQLEPDHVLAELLGRMGLMVETIEAPFEPESGAYGSLPGAKAHDHGHAAGHGHAHREHPDGDDHGDHDGHGHDHPAKPHVHGPGCGHHS